MALGLLSVFLGALCWVCTCESCEHLRKALKLHGMELFPGLQGRYLIERKDKQISEHSTYVSLDLKIGSGVSYSWHGKDLRTGNTSGHFMYYCEDKDRYFMTDNACHVWHGSKACAESLYDHMVSEYAKHKKISSCAGRVRSTSASMSSSWEEFVPGVPGFFVSLGLEPTLSHIPGLGRAWKPVDVSIEAARSCNIDKKDIFPWMNVSESVTSFCLGGWGQSVESDLCEPGFIQYPHPLTCWDGKLNVVPIPVEYSGKHASEGWFCAKSVHIGEYLHFDRMPPFYYIFISAILKAIISLAVFGPPKAGTATSGTLGLLIKRGLQAFTFALAIVGVATDLAQAWDVASFFWNPKFLEGATTVLPERAAQVVRSVSLALLVFCTSGIIANIAAVDSLRAVYEEHYKMQFFLEGERVAQERARNGDPVPIEKRYGIENTVALAGHTLGDWTRIMEEREGAVMKYYILFIEYVKLFYNKVTFICILIGGMAYVWLTFVLLIFVTGVRKVFNFLNLKRAELTQRAPSPNASETYGLIPNTEAKALDEEAIYFFVLEDSALGSIDDKRHLILSEDIDVLYASNVGDTTVSIADAFTTFTKGSTVYSEQGLTYSALCAETSNPEKRIAINWYLNSASGDKKVGAKQSSFVPVSKVQPNYSRSEAKEQYSHLEHVYTTTGSTDRAWGTYFSGPITEPLLTAIMGTLAIRFILFWLCWPEVEGDKYSFVLPTWLGWAHSFWARFVGDVNKSQMKRSYFRALRTFTERTFRSYAGSLHASASKALQAANMLI